MNAGHDNRHIGVFGATLVGIVGIIGGGLLILVGTAFRNRTKVQNKGLRNKGQNKENKGPKDLTEA